MKWKVAPKKSDDLVEQLLLNRGIKTPKEKQLFFNPKISDFAKDLEIPGIKKAQDRIFTAIKSNELIVVFGDYDVDGICASAILYKALTFLGAKVLPYIPHREKEGYGLSKLGLEFARDSGASVVITVDNGIVAYDAAKFAKSLGLDLIITDHHLTQDKLPDAFAIVHSTKMCGTGVAWCLISQMVSKSLAEELLQFAAIATVCDLMPLLGLNRAILVAGLKVLKITTNLGILALVNDSGVEVKDLGSYEIGHMIGPRLNAMGRLEHAIDSLRLLCTKDPEKARKLAKLLSETNSQRQKLTTDAFEEANLQIDTTKKIHILKSKQWSQGIIGLVAGRVCDEYSCPTIAISVGEMISKGSARSTSGINIVETIRQCKDLLIDIGGHPGAAGFSISNDNLDKFINKLELISLQFEVKEPVLQVDMAFPKGALSPKLVDDINKFEPFGFGNPKPILATYGMSVSDIRTVGSGKHLKFKADGIEAIWFGKGEWAGKLQTGQDVDVAYNLEIDSWNGYEKLQLKVKDLKSD